MHTRMPIGVWGAALVVSSGLACGARAQNALRVLEPVAGYAKTSAQKVSGDGRYVVGTSSNNGQYSETRATRWRVADGLAENLGVLDAQPRSAAFAVSDDGQIVSGSSGPVLGSRLAFRWTPEGGMRQIGEFYAGAMSGDGSVICGTTFTIHPLVLGSGGEPIYLPTIALGGVGQLNGAGDLIVGTTYSNPSFDQRGAVWYPIPGQGYGLLSIPQIPNGATSWVRAINRSASLATGGILLGSGRIPGGTGSFCYMWYPDGGSQMHVLPTLPGCGGADTMCMDAAGTVAGGIAYDYPDTPNTATRKVAILWRDLPVASAHDLRWVLMHEYGLDVRGLTFQSLVSMSADGTVICGECTPPGSPPRSFVANIPDRLDPPLCDSDYDLSGFVDREDFDGFVMDFEAGSPRADFDGSGFVDGEDFNGFVEAFVGGC